MDRRRERAYDLTDGGDLNGFSEDADRRLGSNDETITFSEVSEKSVK
jgi:hypothetical protein